MQIPELKIVLDLASEYIEDDYIAAARKRKPPYDIYSEYRDFIRTLLDDPSRYEVLGYKPSDINRYDRARFGDIDELRNLSKEEYREHVDNYLKTPPISQSFYIATNVKNTEGNVVCRWIIDIRISNHKDSDNYLTKEQRANKHTYFGNMYNNGDMNYTLVPVRFVLSYSVDSIGNTNYFANLVNLSKHQTVKGTLDEVKVATQTYLDKLWNTCNSTDPSDLSDLDVITSSINYSRYDKSDITAILSEIEEELNITNQELVDRNFTWDLSGYVWYALFLDIDDEDYVVGIHIKNNKGEDFYVNYDFDIYQYLEDDQYQQEVIQEIVTCIFDEYIV